MNILLDAYLDRNFGDDMMVRLAAHQLREHTLFLSTENKELLLPFENIDNLHDLSHYPDMEIDAVLRVTGSGFIIRNKMGILYALQDLIHHRQKRGKSFSVISCNVGPFVNRLAEKLMIHKMKTYDLIITRDRYSEKFVQNKLKRKENYCFPDIIFSLPDEWLGEPESEGYLGISVYRNTQRPYLNYPFYRKMAEVSDLYIEKTGKKVLLLAFDLENENDLAAAVTVRNMCKNKHMIDIIMHEDNGDNIINAMKKCSYVIGVRFHSIVMAMRMGIDVLPLAYSHKTKHMLEDLGYDKANFTIDEVIKTNGFSILKPLLNEQQKFDLPKEIIEAAKGHIDTFKKVVLEYI